MIPPLITRHVLDVTYEHTQDSVKQKFALLPKRTTFSNKWVWMSYYIEVNQVYWSDVTDQTTVYTVKLTPQEYSWSLLKNLDK